MNNFRRLTMTFQLISAIGIAALLVGCGRAEENASLSSTPARSEFAVVKSCVGVMNEKWLTLDGKSPAEGKLDITVETLTPSKKIIGRSLRKSYPKRLVKGTNEILPSGILEIKHVSIESLTVKRVRGSLQTFVKAAPKQTALLTTEGESISFDLVSLEFKNGDGADYVTLKLNMVHRDTAQPFNGVFAFEGCRVENLPLLLSNSK
jgi:hypothetical protein